MSLKLYMSNRLEKLAELFRRRIHDDPPESVFTPETVVVQTGGMELFLRKFLAETSGIAANIETPFLNRFVNTAMRALLSPEEGTAFLQAAERFAPDSLRWRIYAALSDAPEAFPEARKYAADDERRAQLSARLAGIFDRYIWYHYDMLADWRSRPEVPGHWEKALYLTVVRQAGPSPDHFFRDVLRRPEAVSPGELPRRISLFGIGAMPPLMLDLFRKLSEYIDVHMFYLNPCGEYWGSIRSDAQLRRTAEDPAGPEIQTDNPLLANLGMWGRDFFDNTAELLTGAAEEEHFFDPAPSDDATILELVQQDILRSRNRTAEKDKPPRQDDRSIGIHSCHNKRREVEILHDQLLLAVDELGVRPDGIIVMAPDINAYAPFIDAVFSSGPLARAYHISDRSLSTVSSTAEDLTRILDLGAARCTATEILAILDAPAVKENFRFDDDAMAAIKKFIDAGKIRWGENAGTREEFSGVPFDEFSWREGLDRLLLGLAAAEPDGEMLNTPWAPAGRVPAENAELLGTFAALIRNIFRWRHFFQGKHTPEEWVSCLEEITETMYGRAVSFKDEISFIRDCLAEWLRNTRTAAFDRPLPVSVLREALSGVMGLRSSTRGYLAGGITFCSLVPMRSIPADVIAVLGLRADDFPGKDPLQGLNISTAVRGERSRLREDRYLFLETLISARKRLLLFYTGQDNYPEGSQPSAPLADLLSYLREGFGIRETRHFSCAWAPAYFDAASKAFFSYSKNACGIAREIRENAKTPEPERSGLVIRPREEPGLCEYKLDDLVWTLADPLKNFLRNATGTSFASPRSRAPDDSEPVKLELPDEMLTDILHEADRTDELGARLEHDRLLPPGEAGRRFLRDYCDQMQDRFGERRGQLLRAKKQYVYVYSPGKYSIGGFIYQVPGDLNQILVSEYRSASSRIRFYLAGLCNAIQTKTPERAADWAFLKDAFFTLPVFSPEEADRRLIELLELAKEIKRRPVPLFPKASPVFAETGSMSQALTAFTGSPKHPGDLDAPRCRDFFGPECFADPDFAEEFQRLAQMVCGPVRKDNGT